MNIPIEVALGDGDIPRWITVHVRAGTDRNALARKCALILGVDPEVFPTIVRADRQNSVGQEAVFVQPLAKLLLVRKGLSGPRPLTVLAFGDDSFGQLGRKAKSLAYHDPKPLPGLLGRRVTCVSAGLAHSAFVLENGALLTCGRGSLGRLGFGEAFAQETDIVQSLPRRVEFPQRCMVASVNCSEARTFCITAKGQLFVFGEKGACLGLGDAGLEANAYAPTEVTGIKAVKNVSSSKTRVIACTSSGKIIYVWGKEPDGERSSPAVKLVCDEFSDSTVDDSTSGIELDHYSLLALSDGSFQELAAGLEAVPETIPKTKASKFRKYSIATGQQQNFLVNDDGDALCIAANASLVRSFDSASRINLKRGGKIRKVFSGSNHTIFISDEGRPFGMGNSLLGQLTVRTPTVPEPVWLGNNLDCVDAAAIGENHTLLLYSSYVSPISTLGEDDDVNPQNGTKDIYEQTRESCVALGSEACVVS